MAEPTLKDVVERLRAEGQLTRNTGANSIKSIKITITTLIDTQTKVLQEILDVMTKSAKTEETKEKLGRAKRDEVKPPSKIEDKSKSQGIISKIFDPAREEGVKLGGLIIAPIMAPLKGLLRLLKAGGPIAITTGLLWAVFKDIGENESFINAIENIKRVWNESLLPMFERIQNIFQEIDTSTGIGRTLEFLKNSWNNFVYTSQDLLSNVINTFTGVLDGIIHGLNNILDGDVFTGILKIADTILEGVVNLFDSISTFIAKSVFGDIFGEDGTILRLLDRKIYEISDFVKLKISNFFSILENKWNSLIGEDGIIGIIWSPIDSYINWIKTLFSDPVEGLRQLWNSYVGTVNSIADLLFVPINAAINWIREKFGWSDDDSPAFSIREILDNWVEDVTEWIKSIFSFLPSLDIIRDQIDKLMPSWLRKSSGNEEMDDTQERLRFLQTQRTEMIRPQFDPSNGAYLPPQDTSRIDAEILELENIIASFRTGTKGFIDFGIGTPAILHGFEAVVPRNTPAGEFLANNFTENWEPIMRRISGIESSALQQSMTAPIIITNAPTVAPINNNVRGGTNINNTRMTAIAAGESSGLGRFAN
jgi:hypothetical protein